MSELVMNRQEQKPQVENLAQRLHHTARVVKDHEKTTHFCVDIIGLPLIATWTEAAEPPGFPGKNTYFATRLRPRRRQRARRHAGRPRRDPGAARESRLSGPMGRPRLLPIDLRPRSGRDQEFTSDPADVPQFYKRQGREAHATLKPWVGGDLTPNNNHR